MRCSKRSSQCITIKSIYKPQFLRKSQFQVLSLIYLFLAGCHKISWDCILEIRVKVFQLDHVEGS